MMPCARAHAERRKPAVILHLSRALLGFVSFTFFVFGGLCLASPEWLAGVLGLTIDSPNAAIEIRAFYGGLELGLGAIFAVLAARREWVRPGLVALALILTPVLAARILGIVLDGADGRMHPITAVLEGAMLAVNLVLLYLSRSQPNTA